MSPVKPYGYNSITAILHCGLFKNVGRRIFAWWRGELRWNDKVKFQAVCWCLVKDTALWLCSVYLHVRQVTAPGNTFLSRHQKMTGLSLKYYYWNNKIVVVPSGLLHCRCLFSAVFWYNCIYFFLYFPEMSLFSLLHFNVGVFFCFLTRILLLFQNQKYLQSVTNSTKQYQLCVVVTENEGKCIVRIIPTLQLSCSTLHCQVSK